MNKVLVVVFDSEEAAYKGQTALKDVTLDGDISLYATALISKQDSGKVSVKQSADEGPIGTWIGFLTGSLTGMLAGPVGMMAGASLGSMTGMFFDLNKSGVDITFADDVARLLAPGKTAILADVDETWEVPVDTRMGECGGTVYRRLRNEVVEDQLVRESKAYHAELDELKREREEAKEERKAEFQAQIDKIKKKLEGLKSATDEKLKQVQANASAKIAALESDLKDASDRKRKKIEKRKAKVEADLAVRSEKLQKAETQIKESLAS